MIQTKIIHDTIVVSHKDTIVKTIELVSKAPVKVSPIVDFFNTYSNLFTGLASIVTLIAVIVSIRAINKTTKDGRHQILVEKLEEIIDILHILVTEYPNLYSAYNLLETEKSKSEMERILHSKDFTLKWANSVSKIEVDMYLDNVRRLLILANLYLGERQQKSLSTFFAKKVTDLKFGTLMFAEICNDILQIIKYKNLSLNSFPDRLPEIKVAETLVRNLSAEISKIIDFGDNSLGYAKFKNEFYKNIITLK